MKKSRVWKQKKHCTVCNAVRRHITMISEFSSIFPDFKWLQTIKLTGFKSNTPIENGDFYLKLQELINQQNNGRNT